MRRRLFIKLCTCSLGAGLKSAHAWPTTCEDEKSQLSDAAGCMVMGANTSGSIRNIEYKSTLDDVFLWRGFVLTQGVMEKLFAVKPSFFFYDDRSGPNAWAYNVSIDGSCTPDGSVVFGTTLIATERESNPSMWGSALSVIVAHEYGHIVQYRRKLSMETFRKELHADFLAGWAIATMNMRGIGNGVEPSVAASSLFSKGNYDFNAPNFHGTPAQRSSMMIEGYGYGLRGRDLQSVFDIGVDRVSVI